MQKAIISGILVSLILLVGCNTTEVLESEQEAVISQGNGGDEGISSFLSALQNEITDSITEETELTSDSLAIMLDGSIDELTVSVGFPKDAKTDGTLIQQLVEDSIKNVAQTEATGEDVKTKIKVKIEKY